MGSSPSSHIGSAHTRANTQLATELTSSRASISQRIHGRTRVAQSHPNAVAIIAPAGIQAANCQSKVLLPMAR